MKTVTMHFSTTIILLFASTCLFSSPTISDSSIIYKRSHLISQNDSIDLLKQTFKRKGVSLTELEEKQSLIHDSLKLINQSIQNSGTQPEQSSLFDFLPYLPLKPTTIFDWIIIVVGIVAVISGFFLVIGMLSMAKAKKNSRLKKAIPKEITTQKKTTIIPSQPIEELRALANSATDSVNQLRRQLRNAENDKPSSENTPEIAKRIPQTTIEDVSQENDSEHKRKIIDAAQSGMSPQEISKKYHISTDQVSLILKVAGVKLKKG
jgi:hypothetical protein